MSTDGEHFTPLNEAGERLRFPLDTVQVVAGELFQRRPGYQATVVIGEQRYIVYARQCDLPGCWCDAVVISASTED